ncbi:MAG TPA: DinB family protein [Vicinamibacteria bacterium]|jgi:hypothetical protein|nr:DinB family protein [Vicinamibacteria bacterium]
MSEQRRGSIHDRLLVRLEQQAEDVGRLTAGLAEESLVRQTVPGKWSLKELVCHLVRSQQVFRSRIEAILSQDAPAFAPYESDGDPQFEAMRARASAEVLELFFRERRELVLRLQMLSPGEWHRSGRHPEYPHYALHFVIEYLASHEAHHLYQMLQRRAFLGVLPD